ncbi:hypothetical protein PF004_g9657 [Phytophthora fragariae]|uniref:Uncharacterized protein n=1 Tax=Phytophthora fragariae TaxID=53985 RepID=A0A6G0P383_9STRA|nr:hypothetical protein PF004_g9657 [Phytophthora fragariae]
MLKLSAKVEIVVSDEATVGGRFVSTSCSAGGGGDIRLAVDVEAGGRANAGDESCEVLVGVIEGVTATLVS